MELKKIISGIVLVIILGISSLVSASSVQVPQSTLYNFRNTLEMKDDFMPQNAGSTSVGELSWVIAGGITIGIDTVINRPGIIQKDTTAVITTNSYIVLGQNGGNVDGSAIHKVVWMTQLLNNDANTTYRLGTSNSPVNPPNSGIYIEKLDGDTNWFCVTRSGGVQTRVDSTIAVTTAFVNHTYIRNSSGVQFSIDYVNVCGLITTNIPTLATNALNPFVEIVNSAAASKKVNIDYFQMQIFGLIR